MIFYVCRTNLVKNISFQRINLVLSFWTNNVMIPYSFMDRVIYFITEKVNFILKEEPILTVQLYTYRWLKLNHMST